MTGEDICAPLLIGPRVHVYKEGRLFAKSSPLRSKRPVSVTLTGTILTLCDNAQSKPRKYNLENGRLLTHAPSNKLVLRLASEKVSLFANSKEDFQEWIAVLSDAMYWHVQRFYEFGDVVGKGAFATVVKGRHKVSGESVAIKVVGKGDCNAEEVKYLQREINIVERMHHRNVVQMVDLFESKRNLYMVLEYIPGGTLQTFVERHGPLEERHAKNVMRDVLTAVEYIHGMSVVHRDIKVCVAQSWFMGKMLTL